MRIGVIAASGKEGRLIVKEAVRRGHDVTAIVRNASHLEDKSVKVLEKDIFDLTKSDLQNFDVVISAFGVIDVEHAFQYVTTTLTLIDIMEKLPNCRLIISGGGASLYEDATMTRRLADHIEDVPEAFRAIPYNAFLGFEELKKSSCAWTYFSPAKFFDPDHVGTGNYVLGTEYLIQNNKGESYLTYTDGAAAIVSEAERGDFIRRRFTAVSNM